MLIEAYPCIYLKMSPLLLYHTFAGNNFIDLDSVNNEDFLIIHLANIFVKGLWERDNIRLALTMS